MPSRDWCSCDSPTTTSSHPRLLPHEWVDKPCCFRRKQQSHGPSSETSLHLIRSQWVERAHEHLLLLRSQPEQQCTASGAWTTKRNLCAGRYPLSTTVSSLCGRANLAMQVNEILSQILWGKAHHPGTRKNYLSMYRRGHGVKLNGRNMESHKLFYEHPSTHAATSPIPTALLARRHHAVVAFGQNGLPWLPQQQQPLLQAVPCSCCPCVDSNAS